MNLLPVILACSSLIGMALAVLVAAQQGRRRLVWAILGLLLGILAPLVLALSAAGAGAAGAAGARVVEARARSGAPGDLGTGGQPATGIATRLARAYRVIRWEEIGQVPVRVWTGVLALAANMALSSCAAALVLDANAPPGASSHTFLQAMAIPAALALLLPVGLSLPIWLPFGLPALLAFGGSGFSLFRGMTRASRWWSVLGHVLLLAGYLLGAGSVGEMSRLR